MQPTFLNMKDKKEMIKKLVSILFTVFVLFLLGIFALSIYSTLQKNSQFNVFTVLSGSMRPTFNEGDLIFVKKEKDYKVKDIVTFSSIDQAVITHRIVGENEDGTYKTKGDYNSAADITPLEKDLIIGKYIFKIPWLGWVINFVKSKAGLIIAVIIPSLIIVGMEIRNIITEAKKLSKKNKGGGKAAIALLLVLLLPISSSFASFSAKRTLAQNTISTAIVDFAVSESIYRETLSTTSSKTRRINIYNTGTSSNYMHISATIHNTECNQLTLSVYDLYNNNIYNGSIAGFDLYTTILNPSSNLPLTLLFTPTSEEPISCNISINLLAWQAIFATPDEGFTKSSTYPLQVETE